MMKYKIKIKYISRYIIMFENNVEKKVNENHPLIEFIDLNSNVSDVSDIEINRDRHDSDLGIIDNSTINISNEIINLNLNLNENENENINKNKTFFSRIKIYFFPSNIKKNKIIKHENNIEFKNKLISVFFHIFLMSVFEILFYFLFIVNIEKQIFLEKIKSYNENIQEFYNENITPEQHIIISNYVYQMFNNEILSELKENYKNDMKMQHVLFKNLLKKAIIISSIIGFLFMSSIIYGRKEMKILWILFENILLFLLLGLYEYIFFNMIILKYNPITDGEIQYIFVCDFLSIFNIEC